MKLSIVKSKNATQYYVIKSIRVDGRTTSKVVEKIGTYDELIKNHPDPETYARAYVDELNRKEKESIKHDIILKYDPNAIILKDNKVLYEGGYLFLQKIFYELHLDYVCRKISDKYDFEYSLKDILATLLYGRILFPKSKSGTYELSKDLLEPINFELHDVYRALSIIAEETDYIQESVYKYSKDLGKRNDGILFYDCTNFFFEVEHEEGMRKYGHSKEHRPNPIIQLGMFMDGDGIPLAFTIVDGNTNEQITLKPLEKQIIQDFGLSKFVVCTDAGLSSTANRKFNNFADRAFVTTQSIKKMKDFQKEWALNPKGWRLIGDSKLYNIDTIINDSSLRRTYKDSIFYKEEWFNENDIEQKYIVTFSLKYLEYCRHIRDEQITRAEAALVSAKKSDRTRQTDYKRFISKISVTEEGEVASKVSYELNTLLIKEEEKYDGFYAVATNLEGDVSQIIRINSGRWEIEECFRIMKTEFKSRPVYLSRDDRIKAHFTTCFLALVVFRYLEIKLNHKYTCSEIINGLRSMKFFKQQAEGFSPAYTRTDFTDNLHEAFGFRTDYEIISKADMRKIISNTKKR